MFTLAAKDLLFATRITRSAIETNKKKQNFETIGELLAFEKCCCYMEVKSECLRLF